MLFDDMTNDAVLRSIYEMEARDRPLDTEMMLALKQLYNNQSHPIRVPGMSDRIYTGREESWTPINFTAMLVDKIASVLYGRAVTRTIGNEEVDANLARIYKSNKSALVRVSKMSSLCGYGAIRLRRRWDGYISFDTYSFSEVTPIMDTQDPYGRPHGLVFTILTDSLPNWASSQVPKNKGRLYTFKEIITRNTRNEDGKIIEPGMYKAFVDDKEVKTPSDGINPLGDYLGAVYWRGLDHPFESWGKSDILPLYETLVAINELFTDGRELMLWGIHSPIILTNADGTVKWEYSPRSIWEASGENIEVKRLESGTQNIDDFQTFVEMLLNMFHQTSRVPSVAVGDLNGIGKASSGRAFEIAMIPLKELIDEKETICTPQEMELLKEILAKQAYYGDISGYTSNIGGFNMPDVMKINKLTEDISVVFAPVSFPDVVTGETLTAQVAGDIRSQENAIATLHEEWSASEIEAEVKKIEANKTQGADALATQSMNTLRDKLGSK